MFTCLGLFSVPETATSYKQIVWEAGNLLQSNLLFLKKTLILLLTTISGMCPLSSEKLWQKRIMGRWKRRQEKGTCWLPRWNVHRKQKTAISIQFNGVFSPIHNWKCVYCFVFPLWQGATNLILHIESKWMVRIMHPLTLFLSQRMGQSEFPAYPRLCKQIPRILVPSGYWWPRTARDVAQSTTTLKLKSPRNTSSQCFPFKWHFTSCLSTQHPAVLSSSTAHTLQMGILR